MKYDDPPTTPTPAQIEAAAREINIDGHYMDYFARDLAFKALTAAIEVEEPMETVAGGEYFQARDNATIERCAQIVENSNAFAWRTSLSATIRRLKDEGMATPTPAQIEAGQSTNWPDPTPEMLSDPRFEAIWQCIKRWDINVPHAYSGYCGANGNHVRAILDALTAATEVAKPMKEIQKYEKMVARNKIAELTEAATIERCAQVILSFYMDGVDRPVLQKMVAAIRKLKDEA